MKPTLHTALLALAGITLFATPAGASAVFADGDLCLAFYQKDALTDTVVQANTYVVNLGPASLYRENTLTNVSLSTINPSLASSNINADLVATFGADWAESGTVRWCLVGGVKPAGSVTVGDPARTSYFSRSRSTLSVGASGPDSSFTTPSATNVGNMSTAILTFFTGNNNGIGGIDGNTVAEASQNAAAAILPTSNRQSLEELLPPVTPGLFFGQGVDPQQRFSTGTLTGGGGVEGALDIYRILFTTTGADVTVGATAGNAVARVPQFIGAITLDAAGDLKMVGVGAAASTDTDNDGMTDTWETTYFGNLAQTATGDFDADNTDNLTEFRLGLIPNSGSSRFAVTRGAAGALTWPSVTGVSFQVLRSATLGVGSWTVISTVPGTAGTATYTDPTPPSGSAFYRIALQP